MCNLVALRSLRTRFLLPEEPVEACECSSGSRIKQATRQFLHWKEQMTCTAGEGCCCWSEGATTSTRCLSLLP